MQKLLPLNKIFEDKNYAWSLLEAQIQIELSEKLSGNQIANLLQLYMRGVQKMNSLSDPRQSYFSIKVSSLMSKKNVIKSFNQKPKPMAKKNKPEEVCIQINDNANIQKLNLNEKKIQLQMRMAYCTQENDKQKLNLILAQQIDKQKNISSKITNIIQSHEDRLMERIRLRKLRTTTARSVSQINPNKQVNRKKNIQQLFNNVQLKVKKRQNNHTKEKRCKSFGDPKVHTEFYDPQQSPTKSRRLSELIL